MTKRIFNLKLSQFKGTTGKNYFKIQIYENKALFLECVNGKTNNIKVVADFACLRLVSTLIENGFRNGEVKLISSQQFSFNSSYWNYADSLCQNNNIKFEARCDKPFKEIFTVKDSLINIEVPNSKLTLTEQETVRELYGDYFHPTPKQIKKSQVAKKQHQQKYIDLANKITETLRQNKKSSK